jgi:hypothetical protein
MICNFNYGVDMRQLIIYVTTFIASITCIASGHATFIGYSGAPGTSGRCATSCHGGGGGTIQINGFPTEYVPGQTYTITISHSSGSTIRQFNGSCRIGTGSQNAGVIIAGTRTVTYNTSGETNGIHLSTTSQDNCTFQWTAPSAGTGNVKLYIAGQQGSSSGANSTLTLLASEQVTGINETDEISNYIDISNNFPNPFNAQTTIRYSLPEQSMVWIEVFDILGHKIETIAEGTKPAGSYQAIWDAGDQSSGIYFYRIKAGDKVETKRMTLLK